MLYLVLYYLFRFFFFFLMIRRPPRSTLFPHDALPIFTPPNQQSTSRVRQQRRCRWRGGRTRCRSRLVQDRKSTRLNSSHSSISYAVFCLKKKKNHNHIFNHMQQLQEKKSASYVYHKTH